MWRTSAHLLCDIELVLGCDMTGIWSPGLYTCSNNPSLSRRQVSSVGPIVIVVDALDKNADPASQQVLWILAERMTDLPSNFRVLVTAYVRSLCKPKCRLQALLTYWPHISPEQDISFVRDQLANISSPGRAALNATSSGCQFQDGKGYLNLTEQLKLLAPSFLTYHRVMGSQINSISFLTLTSMHFSAQLQCPRLRCIF